MTGIEQKISTEPTLLDHHASLFFLCKGEATFDLLDKATATSRR